LENDLKTAKAQKHFPPEYELQIGMRIWFKSRAALVDPDLFLEEIKDWSFHRAHTDWDKCLRTNARTRQAKLLLQLNRGLPVPRSMIVEAQASSEMEKVKSMRAKWRVPNFRDPLPNETVSEYRLEIGRAMDDLHSKPKIYSVK
jgi:hypothetical protein